MKIIKNAMTDPIEITCPECKSVLEYTCDDIQRRDENTILDACFGFYTGVKRYIVCPVCKGNIDIRAVATVNSEEMPVPKYVEDKTYDDPETTKSLYLLRR